MSRLATDPKVDDRALTRTIFELSPDRFLVFRPRDYQHGPHAHADGYRLRVIKGRIEVRVGQRRMVVDASRRGVTLEPGKAHTTRALEDTWAIVERRLTRS